MNSTTSASATHPASRRHFYAVSFTLFGLVLIALATTLDEWRLQVPIAWYGVNLLILGIAYFRRWTSVFGKTAEGTLRLMNACLMAPFLLLVAIVWRLQTLFLPRQPWSRITPELAVGRRCSAGRLPPGTTHVIDVTAEFPTYHSVRGTAKLLCSPTLDGCAPTLDQCRIAFEAIPWSLKPVVYVCCANGAGRSVTFTAMFLGWLGVAGSADEAIRLIRKERREAGPGADQRAFLERYFPKG